MLDGKEEMEEENCYEEQEEQLEDDATYVGPDQGECHGTQQAFNVSHKEGDQREAIF